MKSIKTHTAIGTRRRLTEVELELMTILWSLEGATVADVLEELPADRRLAYTSVSTILRILEKKGVVSSRKQGRGHLYLPRLSKQEYETWTVRDLVTRVFDGIPAALVQRLLESETLTEDDRASIRALLRKRGAK